MAEKEMNSDLIYFFNICNLIQTPDPENPSQLRIELDNQVSMYELAKEIECGDTGRKYHLHIKHYGEFSDTHMVDIHWKYQNPDKHKWELLNVMTVRFNKNKQLYRIINDTYNKEKIDNPLRLGLIDWRDIEFSDIEMVRVRMFLDHFIDQIMHCSVNGEATMRCEKESAYTRCVWTIPSLCNPDRKEAVEKKEDEESMRGFDEISNDNPDKMSDMDLVLTALGFLRVGTERSSEPYEIKEDENGKITQMSVTRTFKNTNGTYKFVGWFHQEQPCVSNYKLTFHWEKKYNAQDDDKFVKLNTYSILFNYATGSIIRVINKIYDAEIDDPMWLSDLPHQAGIYQVSSFMTIVQRRLLAIAKKKYVTMHTVNMASIKNGGVWKQFEYDVYEDDLMETIIAWHDLYQIKINEPNNIGIFDSVEALKKLKDEVAASYMTHTRDELMEEKDMKKEIVEGMRIETDINKLIDLITRNKQGVMELAQTREDQDHPEKQYKIVINRDYDKNRLIITYAEFSDKTFDASKPNEITQIIVSFYKGLFTDGGAKDSIEKIKIKTTIQDYNALKYFLEDKYNIMHINEIMKFAYARLSPMKLAIEQKTYHKMLKKYQGKD